MIILCLAVTLGMPLSVRLLVGRFQEEIRRRAASTPLIIGARGSRIDLVLHGLYFASVTADFVTMGEADYVTQSGLATAIPLHVKFRTQSVGRSPGAPIVGTTLEYFDFRGLTVARGGTLSRLGDCLLGSAFAESSGLQPGDFLLSAPKNAFNLAGDYPLRMRVVGILAPSHSPDDEAVFTDIRTAWIIEGIGHGHQELSEESTEQLLDSDGTPGTLTANASVLPYTEITDENVASFHFHGDEADFPVSAFIAVPADRRSQTLLLGRYASVRRDAAVCVKPLEVVEELLAMVFRVEQVFRAAAVVSGSVTGLLFALIVFLNIQLRAPEMDTMQRIGSARGVTGMLVATETGIMLFLAAFLAVAAAAVISVLGEAWLKQWLF